MLILLYVLFPQTAIRKELSSMSFGDLLKLKQRLGTKVYDEAMFGTSSKKTKKPDNFKRVNKNRYCILYFKLDQ